MSVPGSETRTNAPQSATATLIAAPTTKFRAPRVRKGLVDRPALLERALAMSLEQRLTLVCAPAGFGKSTLLAQLVAHHAAHSSAVVETVWLSIDEDDNDANRLFKALLGALQGVALEWDISAEALAAQVDGMGPGTRSSVAALVNTLCSYQGERLIVLVDDLHRIDDADAMQLLDLLIDRLPPEVGLCIGSRVDPSLSLARWRARGELGEIRVADLQFNEEDARAFALSDGAASASIEFVKDALSRTDGWAAGLTLLFGSVNTAVRSGALPSALPSADRLARRNLFDFFAHEVLADLPPRLQEFVLLCSILPELNPTLCNAVTGANDARELLEELYRRNLFLTVLDGVDLTLRFHDLFRDFLGAELFRQRPQQVAGLHVHAAQAETIATRAVTHWLKAQRWDDALSEMARCAQTLMAEGGYATLQRWITQLPDAVQRTRPEVPHLLGMCAWTHWDWQSVRSHMQRACDGYLAIHQNDNYLQCLGFLAASLNGMGELEASRSVLLQADLLEMAPATRVRFDNCRAWNALARGELKEAVQWLDTAVKNATLAPESVYPDLIDQSMGHFTGLPNSMPVQRALQALCRQVHLGETTVRASAVAAVAAWPEFWQGNRELAERSLSQQREYEKHLPGRFAMQMSSRHLQAFHYLAQGKHDAALAEATAMLEVLNAPNAGSLKASWERTYTSVLARVLWCQQDPKSLAELATQVAAQPMHRGWPVVEMAEALLVGQAQMLLGNYDASHTALVRAVQLHARYRMPTIVGDPRICLAMHYQQRDKADLAWQTFAPVLEDALLNDAVGPFLVEPSAPMTKLLALIPSVGRIARPEVHALLNRLALWHTSPAPKAEAMDGEGSLPADLSSREREVLALLATGQSNKLIARALDLSLHTVKRHVANVLGKLGVASRGEAAARWRAHHPG